MHVALFVVLSKTLAHLHDHHRQGIPSIPYEADTLPDDLVRLRQKGRWDGDPNTFAVFRLMTNSICSLTSRDQRMSLSAWNNTSGAMIKPRSLAVLRLITNSIFEFTSKGFLQGLLDPPVRLAKNGFWNGDPQCFRCPQVNDQLHLLANLHCQVSRLSPLQHVGQQTSCLPSKAVPTGSVAGQSAVFRHPRPWE